MKRVKRGLWWVISCSKPLRALAEGILLSLSLRKSKNNIGSNENRHLRVRVLRRGIEQLQKAIRAVGYRQGILLLGEETYTYNEGVFLNLKGTNRYLKVIGDMAGNEGKKMLEFLASKGVAVGTMVDLGANFGEVSLYMSNRLPNAKILAVEASPDNFRILESNVGFQPFPTGNITLVNEAVSDAKGTVEIEKGISAENIIVHSGIHLKETDRGKKIETVSVSADTLQSILLRFGFVSLDFLKVDIEGSEPLLYESLRACAQKIRAILIEVGDKADHRAYLPLMRFLFSAYPDAYDFTTGKRWVSFEALEKDMLSSYAQDVWFVRA